MNLTLSRPRTQSSRLHQGAAAAAVAVLTLVGAAACTADASTDRDPPATTSADGTPEFTGAWAGEFAETYAHFDDDFSRAALADSEISDMEFQEGMTIIRQCYDAAGFSVEYDQYGFETVTSTGGSGDPLDVMGQCAFADGGVAVLYYMIKANPENVEQETLVAECLVRAGVVEPGFTGQDFTEVMDSGDLPWSPGDERIEPCFKDPLGLLAGSGE